MSEPVTATPTQYACGRCIWADREHRDHLMRCHKEPPRIFVDEDGDHMGRWPIVFDDDWCGQFTPRRDEA